MRKSNFKGKCVKWKSLKCEDSICRTYDSIQRAYAEQIGTCDEYSRVQVQCTL